MSYPRIKNLDTHENTVVSRDNNVLETELTKSVFLLLPLLLLFMATPAASGAAPSKCDKTLWAHVYHPLRLQVLNACRFVSGTVILVRGEKDGDFHILLKPDKKYSGLINDANVRLQKGGLVLEPICQKLPGAAINPACGKFRQDLYIPYAGQHINVTGSYVLDHEHSNWAEIHPITSLNLD